jgi:hypothetical protein
MKMRKLHELSYVFIMTGPPSTSGMQIAVRPKELWVCSPKRFEKSEVREYDFKQEKFKWHTTMNKREEAGL